jgi:internalin A
MSDLPDDVLRAIFLGVVDTMSTLSELQLVSKVFRAASNHPLMMRNVQVRFYYPSNLRSMADWLAHLRHLHLHTLHNLEEFSLPSLQALNVSGCGDLRALNQLGTLPNLTELDASFCSNLHTLEGIDVLFPNLKRLDLALSGTNDSIDPLAKLLDLQELGLSFCSVPSLSAVRGLPLRRLDLGGCSYVKDLADLAGMLYLCELNLTNCTQVVDLTPLASLKSMRVLDLSNCRMQDLSPLAKMPNLESLDVSNCSKLEEFYPLTQIETLNANFCMGANSEGLLRMTKLSDLYVAGVRIPELQTLASLTQLKTLNVSTCYGLTDERLGQLAHVPSLTLLNLYDCESVTLKGVRALTKRLPALAVTGVGGLFCGLKWKCEKVFVK